ncbi:MAG TPA: hypothetical protein VGU71_01200 [Candidatus Dormibacteraeota bacterium]|nr:hypothetical protein [Candidatus Dormibacteraeota bacterium]
MSDRLPHSIETDIAVNRDARISGRQLLALVYSGLWRLVFGLPTAAVAAFLTWAAPRNAPPLDGLGLFTLMAVGLVLLGLGAYVSWRGFSFLGDALTGKVSYVTGRVQRRFREYRGSKSYYMVIGPVWTRILLKKTYDALPGGLECFAYYAPGSLHLLSIEPATAAEPHPSLTFGGDAAHAWDRLRWPWMIAAVAAFGLAAGVNDVVIAHPAQTSVVSGTIGEYYVTGGRSQSRYLLLSGSTTEYRVNSLDSASPRPLPALYGYAGVTVDLYVSTDSGNTVLALRMGQTFYKSDLYLHPEHQYWAMMVAGVAIAGLSAPTFAWFVFWIYWQRTHPLPVLTDVQQRAREALQG